MRLLKWVKPKNELLSYLDSLQRGNYNIVNLYIEKSINGDSGKLIKYYEEMGFVRNKYGDEYFKT